MNHLRELLEADWEVPMELTDAQCAWVRTELHKFSRLAMCFWIGEDELDVACELTDIPELQRLPFDHCWFERSHTLHESGSIALSGCAVTQRKGLRSYFCFQRVNRIWNFDGMHEVPYDEATGIAQIFDEVTPMGRHLPVAAQGRGGPFDPEADQAIIGAFLQVLNCSNVQRLETEPPVALQKARAKRGKQPLFSYWTLHLADRGDAKAPGTGTHASPRLHLRRGHARQYAPGLYTWVQAAMVGDKSAGMVNKDYSMDRKARKSTS